MTAANVKSRATWADANHKLLIGELAELRARLKHHADNTPMTAKPRRKQEPPALETLVKTFGLSRFERSVLLLCAAVELDASFAGLCAKAQGDPGHSYPTFSFALAALPEPHWSALSPAGPLRRWRLIEVAGYPTTSLTLCPLRID